MKEEIRGQPVSGPMNDDRLESLADLTDEQWELGLSTYEKHRDKTRAFDPYLTDTDRAMIGLLYDKYEKKFGEDSPQLEKVTRFAGELATLRRAGILVQTDEQKEREAELNERREARAEAK